MKRVFDQFLTLLGCGAVVFGLWSCAANARQPATTPTLAPRVSTTIDLSKYKTPSAPVTRGYTPPTTDWRAEAERERKASEQERRLDHLEWCQDHPDSTIIC